MSYAAITPTSLAKIPRAELREIIESVCSDSVEAYELVQVPHGGIALDSFIAILDESAVSTRRAVARALEDLAGDADLIALSENTVLNLIIMAESLRVTDDIADGGELFIGIVALAERGQGSPKASALTLLSCWGSANSLSALEGLTGQSGDACEVASYLLRARAKVSPLKALQIKVDALALTRSAQTPGFAMALEYALHRMFEAGGNEAKGEIILAVSEWPPKARAVVIEILSDPPLSSYPEAVEVAAELANPDEAAKRPWAKYLSYVGSSKIVPAWITGFAEHNSSLVAGHPPRVYRRLHQALLRRCADELNIAISELKLHEFTPAETTELLEPLLEGKAPVLDMQWATEVRSQRGQMIRLGQTEAFAIVCRGSDSARLRQLLQIDPVTPDAAIRLAAESRESYRSVAASLDQIFSLLDVEVEGVALFCQHDSGIYDELMRLKAAVLAQPLKQQRIRQSLYSSRIDRSDNVDVLLQKVACSAYLSLGLIEWNPVSPLPRIQDALERANLSPSLLEAAVGAADGLCAFPARHVRPLDAGYYYPLQDKGFADALSWAINEAFLQRNGKAEWVPEARLLAKNISVVLDPPAEVRARLCRGRDQAHSKVGPRLHAVP